MNIIEILSNHRITVKSLVHVGAHAGQEVEEYLKLPNVILIEPIPEYAEKLRQLNVFTVIEKAAWNNARKLDFYITDFDEGSSALPPIEHSVKKIIEVEALPLRDLIDENVNVAVIDVQGAELRVLIGANVKQFDMIIVETSRRQRYSGAPTKEEVVRYLNDNGFQCVDMIAHSADRIIEDLVFTK